MCSYVATTIGTRKSVALICFDNPFLKPMEGGKRAMLTRIESLALLDADVDVFLLNKPSEGMADLSALDFGNHIVLRQFQMIARPSLRMLMKYPVCVAKRYVPEVAELLSRRQYDAVIYEGAQVGAYRFEDKVNARQHILYYHDIESIYRAQLAKSEKNVFRHYMQGRESRLFARMEQRLSELFDNHLFISCEECEIFREKYGLGERAQYAPYTVDRISDHVPTTVVPGRILYVGDMSLDSNYRSVEWFVREALPLVRPNAISVELRLVGRISENSKTLLESLDPRVHVLGYVDDLEAEYQSATCMISPILYGAGVKVKLIDALAKGQIVIANTKACEGTKLLDAGCLLVADDPAEMAQLCTDVLVDRSAYVTMAEKALTFIRKNHSKEAQAELLREEIL